ncbi:HamA C-terminal domain-containing protein [Microbacterium sp. NPDC055357]
MALLGALDEIAGGTPQQTRSFFHVIGERAIPDTRVNYRVHWLTLDGNGRDRTVALAQHLYFKIADYCTPRSRILEARARDDREGGNVQMMMLQEEARRLFIDSDTSGEGGELLLYFLLEAELGLPQVLCKMPLKTNSKMPIHGVDGVHAGLLDKGGLAVYWGESKLYADVQSAMTDCFTSIAPFLLDDGTGDAHRDLVLVRERLDTGDRELSLKLVQYFTDDAPERTKLEVRGACLVGFSHDGHGHPFEDDEVTMLAEVEERVDAWAKSVGTRVSNREIEGFEIEFFCMPLPSVEKLRTAFNNLLRHK